MDKAIGLQRIAVAVSTAGRQPSVFARAGYTGGGFKDWFHEDFLVDAQASVMLSWTLWDGFRSRGRRTQAMAQLEQLMLKRSSLVRDIEYEVRSALSRVRTARESVESQTETVGQAGEAVRQAQVRYENGFVTELVVERARLGLAQVRTGLAQAKFDHFMATLDLRKAAGTLEARPPAEDATTEPVQ
jgi:outer membrane protein TolC